MRNARWRAHLLSGSVCPKTLGRAGARWPDRCHLDRRLPDRPRGPDARCRPADPDRPPFRPAIHLIFFDALGRLWVEVETPQGRALDVYDAAGRLVGTLTAPPRVESVIPWADRDRLYTVTADELGVFRVHVFAISAP